MRSFRTILRGGPWKVSCPPITPRHESFNLSSPFTIRPTTSHVIGRLSPHLTPCQSGLVKRGTFHMFCWRTQFKPCKQHKIIWDCFAFSSQRFSSTHLHYHLYSKSFGRQNWEIHQGFGSSLLDRLALLQLSLQRLHPLLTSKFLRWVFVVNLKRPFLPLASCHKTLTSQPSRVLNLHRFCACWRNRVKTRTFASQIWMAKQGRRSTLVHYATYDAATTDSFKVICEFIPAKSRFNVLLTAARDASLVTRSWPAINASTLACDPISVKYATRPLEEKIIWANIKRRIFKIPRKKCLLALCWDADRNTVAPMLWLGTSGLLIPWQRRVLGRWSAYLVILTSWELWIHARSRPVVRGWARNTPAKLSRPAHDLFIKKHEWKKCQTVEKRAVQWRKL